MRYPGPGYGLFGGIFVDILAGLVFIICLVIVVGLLVVLVRFLLVATRAAEIYVARNGQSQPVEPVKTETPMATPATTTTPLATKPVTARTRTPKTPPTF